MAITHATVKAPLQKLFAVADWNANHAGTATPDSHGIADATKHSADETPGQILKADANGLPTDATNTDAQVADAVTKKHAQNTDTDLDAVFEATFEKKVDKDAAGGYAGLDANKRLSADVILASVYPVGAIYISVVSTSPATLFGGTWVAFGAGKVLVSLDSGDPAFDVIEETGGSKTVSIAHVHTTADHTLTAAQSGVRAHTHPTQDLSWKAEGTNRDVFRPVGYGTTLGTGPGPTTAANTAAGATTGHNHGETSGMSAASIISVLQPYIVVYMWKRTA